MLNVRRPAMRPQSSHGRVRPDLLPADAPHDVAATLKAARARRLPPTRSRDQQCTRPLKALTCRGRGLYAAWLEAWAGVRGRPDHDGPTGVPQRHPGGPFSGGAVPLPSAELAFEGEIVAAGHGLKQHGAHDGFGSQASRAAQDGGRRHGRG